MKDLVLKSDSQGLEFQQACIHTPWSLHCSLLAKEHSMASIYIAWVEPRSSYSTEETVHQPTPVTGRVREKQDNVTCPIRTTCENHLQFLLHKAPQEFCEINPNSPRTCYLFVSMAEALPSKRNSVTVGFSHQLMGEWRHAFSMIYLSVFRQILL